MIKRILGRVEWATKVFRDLMLSFKYGIPFSRRVHLGKRVRIVNPQFIKWGGQYLSR